MVEVSTIDIGKLKPLTTGAKVACKPKLKTPVDPEGAVAGNVPVQGGAVIEITQAPRNGSADRPVTALCC